MDEAFLEPLPDARDLRGQLGVPDNMPVIGSTSSFYGYEGIDTLIDAAALLRDRSTRSPSSSSGTAQSERDSNGARRAAFMPCSPGGCRWSPFADSMPSSMCSRFRAGRNRCANW